MNKSPSLRVVTSGQALWLWTGGTPGVCILAGILGGVGAAAFWPAGWIPTFPWGVLGGLAAGRLWAHVMLPKAAQGHHRRFLPLAMGWGALSGLAATAVLGAGVLAVVALASLAPSPAARALAATCPGWLAVPGTVLAAGAGAMAGGLVALALRPRPSRRRPER